MARILVVDDSSIMRRNLSAILKKAGHAIVGEAANGEIACSEYAKCKPDLVTMDITMPVMDGIAAVKKIIHSHPEANIIMISALDQKFMVLSAIQNGAKHYIIKPFTPEKVIQVVNEVLKTVKVDPELMDGPIGEINNAIENISTTIDALEEDSLDDEDADNDMPFTVENKNGMLMININKSINQSHFSSLNMVVQGFLFLKPLKLVINFKNIKSVSDELFYCVEDLIKPVKNVNGIIKVASLDQEFINLAKTKLRDVEAVLYKDETELIV